LKRKVLIVRLILVAALPHGMLQESTPQALRNALSTDWIPAFRQAQGRLFAGMTGVLSTDWIPAFPGMTGIGRGIRFQMTPLPAPAHTLTFYT
jgi:hypothetical protein